MASRGYPSLRCAGFSLWWLLLLRSTGSRHMGFSSCGPQAQQLWRMGLVASRHVVRGMWDLPGPGIEPVSPALAGGFLTNAPPGKLPVHLSLNDTTVCPGIHGTNLGVFLNISLSLMPQIQPISKSCNNTSQTSLECFHFFSISFARTLSQATVFISSTTGTSQSPQIHSHHFLIHSPPYSQSTFFSNYTNLMSMSLHKTHH